MVIPWSIKAGRERGFGAQPIRTKLMIIIVSLCAISLLISKSVDLVVNWAEERNQRMRRLVLATEMIALQSRAALEFLDPVAARENLAALRADPAFRKVCLYNEAGAEFASYTGPEAPAGLSCPKPRPEGRAAEWDYLEMFHDITAGNGRKLGSIYIQRDLSEFYERLRKEVFYKISILLLAIVLIWPLSFYLQRMISRPIMQLAQIAHRFSRDRSQPLRAVKVADDEIGVLVDAFNTMMDEIRRNEQRLGEAINELTHSNTELERFAYICSHDLQEPLRMVSNYARLLEQKLEGRLDEDSKQYLYFITDGAARMRELVNDILTYARIGAQGEASQAVDVGSLVQYVLHNLEASIVEKKAVVHVDDLPVVTGNKTLLTQIFQNLISNGIKFTRAAPEIWIGAKRREEEWEFYVRDNGIGIDPRYHEKVFEVFKRLNRREEFRGTGIGLAICKKAVEYHGGRLWLISEPGKGTTFFFTIPDTSHKQEERGL